MSDFLKIRAGRSRRLKSMYASLGEASSIRGDYVEQGGRPTGGVMQEHEALPEEVVESPYQMSSSPPGSLPFEIERLLGPGTYDSVISKSDSSNPESHSFSYMSLRSAINSVLQDQGRSTRLAFGPNMERMTNIRSLSADIHETFLEQNPAPLEEGGGASPVESRGVVEQAGAEVTTTQSGVFEDDDWAYYAARSGGNEEVARWWMQNATTIAGVNSAGYSDWARWAEANGLSEESSSGDVMERLQSASSPDAQSAVSSSSLIGARLPSEMETSEDGMLRLRGAEGYRAYVYDDFGVGEDKRARVSTFAFFDKKKEKQERVGNPTIGFGHLIRERERDRFSKNLLGGTPMTETEAMSLFLEDVRKHESWKSDINVPLSQIMFDALSSYAFNTGPAGPKRDGIIGELNKVDDSGNPAPDYEGAADAIRGGARTSGGIALSGLAKRRDREADEFLSGIPALSAGTRTVASISPGAALLNLYKQSRNDIRGMGDEQMYKDVDTIENFGDPDKSEDKKKIETMMADMGLKSLNELSREERSRFVKAVLGESKRKKNKKKRSKDSAEKRRRRVVSPFRSNFDYEERSLRIKKDE